MLFRKDFVSGVFAFYQIFLRTHFGYACKFQPTCSHYAHQAYQKHGIIKASLLSLWRVLRCHPFGAGGWDPVPEKSSDKLDQSTLTNSREMKYG